MITKSSFPLFSVFIFMFGALALLLTPLTTFAETQDMPIRVAIFNASMEANNYNADEASITGGELSYNLRDGTHPQIQNIAEIIQLVRPHVIILNEFDYSAQASKDIAAFLKHYLELSQQGNAPINYPYVFSAPVNTGVDSGFDLDGDGVASGYKADAFGYGLFPGHYGMAILSQFPIEEEQIRTFQTFLWKDMPNSMLGDVKNEDGTHFYSEQAQAAFRLSSKSHWDVPVMVNGRQLNILVSHPTPPVFDGFEDRNGKRNHDEIRFWTDYISGVQQSAYIYDDKGQKGGLQGDYFIIAGDLNASPDEGSAIRKGIADLIAHPRVQDDLPPTSEAAVLHTPSNPFAAEHTASWRMRADYVLPSSSLKVTDSGVFWPKPDDPLYRLIQDRQSSSDHKLVWVDVSFGQ
ncbi:endonuclease/exonuclease/phosphatase family protein [Glaciecola sp. XM2]|uniref:endonuclease/exonuclease/phosphatase family protein n=1 Tax=Glaciecola sp. XM2 TaxID=1914931 RepID=UPI003316C526